jgi:RNA polymerase sigma factor (sigma-70 family)
MCAFPVAVESPSTTTLVLLARSGDRSALDALCDRYLPKLQRWAHGRLPSWARSGADTQDLVQDTLVQVTRRIQEFEPRHEGAFQGYLRQALLNKIRDQVRRAKRRPDEPLGAMHRSSDPSPLETAIGTELLDRYQGALLRVKAEDRDAIVARVERGLSWGEVASALNKTSDAAARMAVKRALVRLAREMSRGRE